MTSIEKKMIYAIAVITVLITFSFWHLSKALDNAGGVKGIAITAGKEIKDIYREINKD